MSSKREEFEEYKQKLHGLNQESIKNLIRDLSIELVAATEDSKIAKQREERVRKHIKWASSYFKKQVYGPTKSSRLLEQSKGGLVWYNFIQLFKQGAYPAKNPRCEWRLVSKVHGFSTDQVVYYMRHQDSFLVTEIAEQARGMGLTDFQQFQWRQLYTRSLHTAICLKRLGMSLDYINAKLERQRIRVKGKHQTYTPTSINQLFLIARTTDETPIKEFPRIFDFEGADRRNACFLLQDPTVYPDCGPLPGGQNVQPNLGTERHVLIGPDGLEHEVGEGSTAAGGGCGETESSQCQEKSSGNSTPSA